MYQSHLYDLDELAQSVRDKFSQAYIREAINAYRGGAYRSAIVSTWVAVTYDVLVKITELANQGDGRATAFANQYRKALKEYNDANTKAASLKKLQAIENELLDKARSEFQFINSQEYVDLSRLKDDRNLCAHPAFAEENTLFQPTPDLVRVHIVHAIVHLLQRLPIQGNTAIAQITNAITRPSFPNAIEDAVRTLREYLDRVKEPVIRRLVSILVKAVLRGDVPEVLGYESSVLNALVAISHIHPALYKEQMRETLGEVGPTLDDSRLPALFSLIGADHECWLWLSDAAKVRLKTIIGKYTASDLIKANAFDALLIDDLKSPLLHAFAELSDIEKRSIISTSPHAEFAGAAVRLYAEARSYRDAGQLGQNVLLPMAAHLSPDQVIDVIEAVIENGQISQAMETSPIIEEFFDGTTKHLGSTRDKWQELLDYWAGLSYPSPASKNTGLLNRLRNHGICPK